MSDPQYYGQVQNASPQSLNKWDALILILVFGLFAALVWGAQQMTHPYQLGDSIPITLDPWALPGYALRTVIRMAIALMCSLLFTFTIATWAAKSHRAERIILPFIDIMQSVPVLGFLSISILMFIYLFPNSQLGPEFAAIFALFTSQVWNMALSFYQSLKSIPKDLIEAAKMFHLSAWQTFWRLEVPFAIPPLLWNTMMSLSAGWFFVVASEAISVANHTITLPGIGSYIMLAQEQSNYTAIVYVILTMLLVILGYDQLIFRPLLIWSEKFKMEPNADIEEGCWFLDLIQKTYLSRTFTQQLRKFRDFALKPRRQKPPLAQLPPKIRHVLSVTAIATLNTLAMLAMIAALFFLARFIYQYTSWHEIAEVFYLGLITTIKVTILIILSSLLWVPVGVWIGLRPRLTKTIQPLIQFFAAFPANLLYPVVFMLIMRYHLNVEIWSAPLMILGTQWYILFNVIAGTASLPLELRLAAQNYQLKGWLWWKKLMLPGIFPYYVTGAMTAAGGCWNASIVADVVTWGDTTIQATGLGAYITQSTLIGDFPRLALGIAVMCIYVLIINRLLWHRLYNLAADRYQIG